MDGQDNISLRPLNEQVCVNQPDGFVDPYLPHKVYHLKKALYGLKQALTVWNIVAIEDSTPKAWWQQTTRKKLTGPRNLMLNRVTFAMLALTELEEMIGAFRLNAVTCSLFDKIDLVLWRRGKKISKTQSTTAVLDTKYWEQGAKLSIFKEFKVDIMAIWSNPIAAEEAHSKSTHSRAESSPRDAQGTPTQSAAQASILQGTADFQGTAEAQGAADIPQSPNDYTPTDESQTSGGDEGLLDLYALNRGFMRLKKQHFLKSQTIHKAKAKLKKHVKTGKRQADALQGERCKETLRKRKAPVTEEHAIRRSLMRTEKINEAQKLS
ncbi:gag-pol polyprotein [Tanacetum coccineum]